MDGLGWNRLSQTWSERPAVRFYCACIAVSATAVVACFLALQSWRAHTLTQATALLAAEAVAERMAMSASEGRAQLLPADGHPALRLDAQPEPHEVVHRLERSARALNVDLRRIEVSQVSPAAQALGRVRCTVVAEGRYADLKQWMATWSGEMPSATISLLRLQRAESWQEARPVLEWSGSITVWSRPLGGGR